MSSSRSSFPEMAFEITVSITVVFSISSFRGTESATEAMSPKLSICAILLAWAERRKLLIFLLGEKRRLTMICRKRRILIPKHLLDVALSLLSLFVHVFWNHSRVRLGFRHPLTNLEMSFCYSRLYPLSCLHWDQMTLVDRLDAYFELGRQKQGRCQIKFLFILRFPVFPLHRLFLMSLGSFKSSKTK